MGGVKHFIERMEVMPDEPISLKEAFEKAQGTLPSSDTQEPAEQVEPENQPEVTEPSKTAEETQESLKTKSEADLESIDPKILPPELKPTYDNLMKGFTQGRQKDSDARKQAEKERDDFKRQLDELKSKPQTKQEDSFQELTSEQLAQLRPHEQAQYFSILAEYKAQKAVEKQRLEDFRSQAVSDYEATDPRLKKGGEKYNRFMDSAVGTEMDALLSEYVTQNGSELGFPYKEHLSRLVGEWDGYLKSKFDEFIDEQNQKIKADSEKVQKFSPPTSKATATKSKMSLHEAMKAALDKLGN